MSDPVTDGVNFDAFGEAPARSVLSERERLVYEELKVGELGALDQLAKDIISALYHAGWLRHIPGDIRE